MVSAKTGRLATLALERSPWRSARWLVIAPHADDETLGAGALIHQVAETGRLAGVVVLTDGAGSHDHPDAASRARLVRLRRLEAGRAVRRLAGSAAASPVFLDWMDAHPAPPGSPMFEAAARRLATLCRDRRVDAIAVTGPDDPHCDHQAAAGLTRHAAGMARRPVAVFDYAVWGAASSGAKVRITTRPLSAGLRAYALSAHQSQLTPKFGRGFRLDRAGRLRAASDTLYRRDAYG
ncbi:PIG-L family deacetylase [Brevundimonas sp. EYE_349]|nr:PIG-L family deacetylase [uncultured Brevundimonas sp.]MCK6104064.1 PIG-L family deacetylase [Brevundimonas sp. EYE_349]